MDSTYSIYNVKVVLLGFCPLVTLESFLRGWVTILFMFPMSLNGQETLRRRRRRKEGSMESHHVCFTF